VIVCTFSGWVEAFSTQTERAQDVVHTLLKEIIPRMGSPSPLDQTMDQILWQKLLNNWQRG
jgi:hypothetical protein